MIDEIISRYLRANKRLVVPELGSFIRKDGGEVAFVEFLKKDDGILATLVGHELGLGSEEAAEVLTGWVEGVKKAVASTGRYVFDGVGVMHIDTNGLLVMEQSAAATVSAPPPVLEVIEAMRESIAEPVEESAPVKTETVIEMLEVEPTKEKEQEIVRETIRETVFEAPPEPEPESPFEKKAFTLNDLYTAPDDTATSAFAPEHEPEPVRDFWGNAIEQKVEPKPAEDWFSHSPSHESAREINLRRPAQHGGKKRTDVVMIIAIVAAAAAIISMVIGMARNGSPSVRRSTETEQVVDSVATDPLETELIQ